MKLLHLGPLLATALATTTPYSTWMIQSIMARSQGIISSGAATSVLESGTLSLALEAWLTQYPASNLSGQITSYLAAVLNTSAASFPTPRAAELLPLDRFSVAYALQRLPGAVSDRITNFNALSTVLHDSLLLAPRNPQGGLWYYAAYPQWSYLDGTASFLPFMARSTWPAADMRNQLQLLVTHCHDVNGSGLLVHGYDQSGLASWVTDARTGASPFVWGRAMGWFVSGLVGGYEALGAANGSEALCLKALIASTMRSLSLALVRHADADTGAWWQLPTLPGAPGNFLESSSTALFVYSLLKGARLGIAPTEVVAPALRAYNYTVDGGQFLLRFANGSLGYNMTVSTCSLNSSATYNYYTTRPITPNGLLGEAAFVLASLEVERLSR